MPALRHWKCPILTFFHAHYKNAFPVIILNFYDRDSWKNALNCSQYIVPDTNNFLNYIWFRQKAEFLIKISTKFLGMVTIRNMEKTTVYFLFSLFIQFSAIEIRLVFPQTKFMISWLQWLEKKLGCPCSLVRYSHFSTDRAHVLALMTRKSCAVEMRNAILRNYLKVIPLKLFYYQTFFETWRNAHSWYELIIKMQ